jgi:AcrR family transcriptional regulator
MSAPKAPRHYHHGDLRRALLREAAEILRSEGLAALSLRETARRAGVSAAAPYAHFPDKAALVAALAERGFRLLVLALRRAFKESARDPLRRLTAMTTAYVQFAVEHPAFFQIMFGSERPAIERHPELHEAAHDASGVMLAAIIDCQQAGRVEPGDPLQLALFGWVVIHGLSVLLLAGMMPGATPRRPSRDEVTRLAQAFMRRAVTGLAPRT